MCRAWRETSDSDIVKSKGVLRIEEPSDIDVVKSKGCAVHVGNV